MIMRRFKKKFIAAFLCMSMLFIQSGCGGRDKADNRSDIVDSDSQLDNVGNEDADSDANGEDLENISTEPVLAGIEVECIENIPDNFIFGADISTVKVEYESGVKYYDFDGNELYYMPEEGQKGFFDFLKECGINWVRIRVWNNPYDEEGRGYGGGNNDVEAAKEIGKLAADAGLCTLIDFHYSDFWADPGKYMVPKAWSDMELEDKVQALEEYTIESLTDIVDAGVDVGMVQVGNETVTGLAGETNMENICKLMSAGSNAVRYVSDNIEKEILVALHFTNISESSYDSIAAQLERNQVDYDVFATSYYPFWHGTTENLTNVMKMIAEKYNKKVIVAETSYVYTLEDGDGSGQSVNKDSNLELDYDVSVQGQADAIAAVIKAAADIGEQSLGVFYWEPAWIPVQVYNENDDNAEKILEENKKIWEEKGSGWASSYAGVYDPNDAGRYYGGSSWDNQALFDFEGHPLESINIFKYVNTGAYADDIKNE